ncbi:MAG: hypothetical protein ACOYIK_09465 [Coriobacteriales bacterium]|jgi:Fe-S-cluster-containing dehydrogenase component
MTKAILVDINKCTGCWCCSMSCKMEFGLKPDEFIEYVRTIGGGEIDQAGGTWPNLYLKWMPIFKQTCKHCVGDESTENKPICVYNCPTGAMVYGDADDPESDFSKRREELLDKGFRVYQIPVWEDTRDNVWYAEKGI